MSIIINRVWPRFKITEGTAIAEQMKLMNLKPVKQVVARFDPFHEKVTSIRKFMVQVSGYKTSRTNPATTFSTKIVCDRSEPEVCFDLTSGEKIILKTANLSLLDILRLYNKHITANIPPEVETTPVKTKTDKKKKKR